MHHINGAYTTYYNVKHERAGHLFQGRYKAILVHAYAYAGELSRYIHLNPVRAGMVEMPEKYTWSSYQYWIISKIVATKPMSCHSRESRNPETTEINRGKQSQLD